MAAVTAHALGRRGGPGVAPSHQPLTAAVTALELARQGGAEGAAIGAAGTAVGAGGGVGGKGEGVGRMETTGVGPVAVYNRQMPSLLALLVQKYKYCAKYQ